MSSRLRTDGFPSSLDNQLWRAFSKRLLHLSGNGSVQSTLIWNLAISSGAEGCDSVVFILPFSTMSCNNKNNYECWVIFLYEKESKLIVKYFFINYSSQHLKWIKTFHQSCPKTQKKYPFLSLINFFCCCILTAYNCCILSLGIANTYHKP